MNTSAWEKNLQTRPAKKIKEAHTTESVADFEILTTPCDLGVIRNGGKRGAKHGPQALMAPFKNLNLSADAQSFTYQLKNFTPSSGRPEDFEKVQKEECQFFEREISSQAKRLLHLGGGHDHAFPFAKGFHHHHKRPLIIINVDAHLDTRPDHEVHSGTPFRQLYRELGSDMHLLQVGIHPFANAEENYRDMGTMRVIESISPQLSSDSIAKSIDEWLNKLNLDKAALCLSVDCDGLDASFMPAVSAPNHRGLKQEQFHAIFETCRSYWQRSRGPRLFGLYEYNPVYDNLSQQGARYLASYMHDFFLGK